MNVQQTTHFGFRKLEIWESWGFYGKQSLQIQWIAIVNANELKLRELTS
jgi:hypothetical protein